MTEFWHNLVLCYENGLNKKYLRVAKGVCAGASIAFSAHLPAFATAFTHWPGVQMRGWLFQRELFDIANSMNNRLMCP
jgi:hypothetical protein